MTTDPHGRPTAAELLAAVREFIVDEVMPATTGSVAFHARVASNVLAMVERELAEPDPPEPTELRALGVDTEDELADAIRSGRLDHRFDDVVAALDVGVRRRLGVAHPGYELET